MKPIERVLETVLYVDDLDAAERFYGGCWGSSSTAASRGCSASSVWRGDAAALRPPGLAGQSGIPPHGAHGPGHVCFALPETALDAWRRKLLDRGVAIEAEQTWPRGGRSFYFRDPAGNSLELATPRIWGLPDPPSRPSPGG